MEPAVEHTLREAYRCIKAGDKDGARALIKPVLAQDRANIDAWWLAAHAAATPHDTRLALAQVLQLNPDHAPARVMLDRLNAEHPLETDPLAAVPPPVQRRRSPAATPLVSNHWMWNVVLVLGLLGLSFGSLALISGVAGFTWFEDTVEQIGEQLGLEGGRGQVGDYGTVPGGDPAHPQEVPITQNKPIGAGDIMTGSLRPDEAHVWTFSAQARQEVAVLLQFTVAGDARYTLELWNSAGKRLATGVGDQNSGTVTLIYTLGRTGQYALVIIGRPGGPRGDYALGVDILE